MTESPLVDSSLVDLVFSPGYDPIAYLNKAMAFLIAVASSRFPSTNNQLRTSSIPRNQATIQDGRVTVQQPKRPRNAAWYKDKAMLAEAQEAGQILDEEQLVFLADPGVPDGQAVQTIIPNNAAFQTEDLDTYDSDYDDISNAKAVLMANISNYGSDVILENAQRIKPTLYDGIVISDKHVATPVIDDEETLILEEESRSKMSEKEKDPEAIKQNKMEAPKELPKSSVDKQCLEIAKKELLLENDRLLQQIMSQDVLLTVMNYMSLIEYFENNDLKAQLQDKDSIICMFKLDLEPLAPRLLQNREAHIDYLKYTQEQADILREIVEQAKAKQPLDNELDFAKSKKSSHQPKAKETNQEKLYLLHMDLCGLMRVLMQDKKPDLSFFYVFGALCYPTNDNDDLGKLNAKVDNGIFVGYAPAKKAFRIYNKRTRKIIETIHVTFDELTAMASEQFSSGPRLHSMTPATSSLGLAPNIVSITLYSTKKEKMDWITCFDICFDEYFTPPSIAFSLVQEAAASRASVLTDSPVLTSIDQDAPSTKGFVDQEYPSHVYKLKKALYGLKQAPRAWYDMLSSFLISQHFSKGAINPKLLQRQCWERIITDEPLCSTMSMTGMMSFFLGLQISQSPRGIFINQSKYASEIVKKYGLITYYGFQFYKIPLYYDNKSAIALCCNNVQHSRAKHIDVRYHFIMEQVENGVVELYFVQTKYQLGDIFTKPLPRERFNFLIEKARYENHVLPEMLKKSGQRKSEISYGGSNSVLFHMKHVTTQAQQKALDDALVAPADRLEFRKGSSRLKT
ncbi:retrovirus-related pol polyprotein from transposon TNT 1-94 [Tanacetum coccineum]|uniref:Retrovirus-related pol polyprotein from transposon TNT 1-94 n=1 Tax=Tanacetum coccineum TaxID=301880 RepID=A0ABQ4Y6Y0_9ASTR